MPAIGVKLGLLATQDATYKGREVYNCMLQNSYFASAGGWVFEGRGHGILSSGGSFSCTVLNTQKQLRELYKDNYDYFGSTNIAAQSMRTASRDA